MDDLSDKISKLLNDPEGLEQIKGLAQNLLKSEPPKKEENLPDVAALMQVLNALKSTNDKSVELLLALKPHLSKNRQARLDTAITLLKIYSILPLIKDSKILGDLF